MLLGGVSVKGSYHSENQDSFLAESIENGFVLVLSDGLGSKPASKTGSKAICEAVVEEAAELKRGLADIALNELIINIHNRWLKKLSPYTASDCYATLLALIFYCGRLIALRLGDGFIGFWADNEARVLFDKKETYFANETDCLTETVDVEQFESAEYKISNFNGGVMCSDGIQIGKMQENDLIKFTKDFIASYNSESAEEINKDVEGWVKDWKSSDDKTLAYSISEGNNNGQEF